MYKYLFFGTIFLWYKDKNYLERSLNNFSWVLSLIYGKLKTSKTIEFLENYLLNTKNITHVQIYAKDTNFTLIPIELKNIKESNSDLFYVLVPLHSTYKILVFDNKDHLINNYDDLVYLTEKYEESFSNIMEASVYCVKKSQNKDVTNILKKYTSSHHYYKDVTEYGLRAGDLYDFESKCFILQQDEQLSITNMNLDTTYYTPNDILF